MVNAASETIKRSLLRMVGSLQTEFRLAGHGAETERAADSGAGEGTQPQCTGLPENHALPASDAGASADGAESPEDLNRIVRCLAGRLHARLPQGCGIEVADLIQAGNVGLLKASQSFEASHGAPLVGYAKFRIRGEMLDLVRRSAGRERPAAGPPKTDSPGADPEDLVPASPDSSPQNSVLRQQRAAIIRAELQRLSARDRAVIRLRYSREMTLREIGAELQVNESRACQLHQSALGRLKRALWRRGVRHFSHL